MKNNNIIASLKYGRIWSGKLLLLWIFLSLFGLGAIIFSLPCWTFWNLREEMIEFIACMGVGILFLSIGLTYLIKNHILKKKIDIWLEDAVELKAVSQRFDRIWSFPYINFRYVKIHIEFRYNKKRIHKYSGDGKRNGYDTVFYKYADREIDILYSPKYDEVMILKESK